jgi:hypothetical protein
LQGVRRLFAAWRVRLWVLRNDPETVITDAGAGGVWRQMMLADVKSWRSTVTRPGRGEQPPARPGWIAPRAARALGCRV